MSGSLAAPLIHFLTSRDQTPTTCQRSQQICPWLVENSSDFSFPSTPPPRKAAACDPFILLLCSCCCWVLELVDIYSGASRSTSICSCWCCWCCCCGGGCCCHLAPAPGRPSTHRATLQRSPCTAAASRPAIEWGTSATDQRAQTEPTCQVAAPLRLAAGPGPGPGQGQE